jgi:hypothetical protein
MGGYEKDGNYRRGKLYGRKEWEGMRRMGIIGGKTMAGKNGRVPEGWDFRREFKSWKSGREWNNWNYRREAMAGKNGRVLEGWESFRRKFKSWMEGNEKIGIIGGKLGPERVAD